MALSLLCSAAVSRVGLRQDKKSEVSHVIAGYLNLMPNRYLQKTRYGLFQTGIYALAFLLDAFVQPCLGRVSLILRCAIYAPAGYGLNLGRGLPIGFGAAVASAKRNAQADGKQCGNELLLHDRDLQIIF